MAQTPQERKAAQRSLAGGANPIAGMGAISARAASKARAKTGGPTAGDSTGNLSTAQFGAKAPKFSHNDIMAANNPFSAPSPRIQETASHLKAEIGQRSGVAAHNNLRSSMNSSHSAGMTNMWSSPSSSPAPSISSKPMSSPPSGTAKASGKKGVRAAVKQKVGSAFGGKKRSAGKTRGLGIKRSPHEGKNADLLRKATGSA